jgi:hypothetical protein
MKRAQLDCRISLAHAIAGEALCLDLPPIAAVLRNYRCRQFISQRAQSPIVDVVQVHEFKLYERTGGRVESKASTPAINATTFRVKFVGARSHLREGRPLAQNSAVGALPASFLTLPEYRAA